jgi:hypothetical protein
MTRPLFQTKRLAPIAVLAFAIFAVACRPAAAAPLDLAGLCGQLFLSTAQTAAAAMPNFTRYMWLATATTKTEIDVDLIVYGKSTARRYTGFACTIGAGNTMTIKSPTPSSGK